MSRLGVDLVLVKAATVRQHLRENLHALQLGLPSPRATYSYHRKWLAPGVLDDVEPGASVLVALGNSPYQSVVPVRLARLVELRDRDGLTYELELELQNFVEPDGVGFGRELAELPASARPGGAFVLAPPPGFRPVPVPAREHARVWRQAVDVLRSHQNYAGSAFFRLDGYEVAGSRIPAYVGPPSVPPGDELALLVESRNDHLAEAELAEIHLLADAAAWSLPLEDAVAARGVMRFPVPIEAGDAPRLAFSVGVRPRWADSSVLEIEIPVLEVGAEPLIPVAEPETEAEPRDAATTAPAPEPPQPPPAPIAVGGSDSTTVALRPTDGQRLLQALRRDGWSPSLAVLEDHLLRWFPGDPKLEEARLRLLFDSGGDEVAAATIATLPPDVVAQIDPWLRFRASVHRGDGDGALAALTDIQDFGPEHLDRLASGLARLSDSAVDRILTRLADALLGEQTLAELLLRFDPAAMDVGLTSTVADLVEMTLSEEEALSFLQRRLAAGFDVGLAVRAADAAARLPGRQPLGVWIEQLIRVELDGGDPELALARVNELQSDLTLAQEMDLVRLIASRLDTLDPMVGVIDRVARDAISHGDFDAAAALVGLLAKAGAGEAVSRLEAELRRALEQTEVVRDYLRVNLEHRRERAAKAAEGKTLILVGGPKEEREHSARLAKTFRFRAVEWLPCERDKKPPLAKLATARADSHVVLILTDHIGHATSDAVERECGSRISPIRCPTHGVDTIEQKIIDRLAPIQ